MYNRYDGDDGDGDAMVMMNEFPMHPHPRSSQARGKGTTMQMKRKRCRHVVMVGVALLLACFSFADASSSESCTRRTRIPSSRTGVSANSLSLAFQSFGSIGHHINIPRCSTQRPSLLHRIHSSENIDTIEHEEDSTASAISSCTSNASAKSSQSRCQSRAHYLPTFQSNSERSRRTALLQILSLAIISSSLPDSSSASEIDTTGQLYSPKNEMIKGGGSTAARGIKLKEKAARSESLLKRKGLIQDVYDTRFITYLTRFLLVFDPAASAWWTKNSKAKVNTDAGDIDMNASGSDDMPRQKFAEFAESVEVGLADYFLGPYGSYASVAAAKAGISAAASIESTSGAQKGVSFWDTFNGGKKQPRLSKRKAREAQREAANLARQGILNLYSLLKARYTSIEEKQQLAILFSFIRPELQPVQEIRGLLGEVDNGTIAEIELVDISDDYMGAKRSYASRDDFRMSSRRGGGYSKNDTQIIDVELPAPLGSDYEPAKVNAVMKPTTRILRIDVVDGGEGYTVAPDVIVKQRGVSQQCEACAIIDRKGAVSEVIVLDPGFGYGTRKSRQGDSILPVVEIRERKSLRNVSKKKVVRPAKAVAELEYKLNGVQIVDGGSGYLFDQPPRVSVKLPDVDPDWYGKPADFSKYAAERDTRRQLLLASVSRMRSATGGVFDTKAGRGVRYNSIVDATIQAIQNNPTALLPDTARPQFSKFINGDVIDSGYYSMPLPSQNPKEKSSSIYRSIDPLFGAIGKAPVTKNAVTLSSDQYLRLGLSGAICTVLVRTALNPLELVKTKIQLQNDDEIISLAKEKALANEANQQSTAESKVSTTQVIASLVEVRGPFSLFQSADITFLTSIVFGLFGFGATELFRRSFSAVFFDEKQSGTNEFLLLFAAALATLLTCAAGAPFEILRVRSMSTTENQGVGRVFTDFVHEQSRGKQAVPAASSSPSTALATRQLIEDIAPLWSSFLPIVSRELPFAVTKFFVFDLTAGSIANIVNSSKMLDDPLVVGVGSLGLLLSAFSGALAGIAGAFVSHPADLVLTLTSASSREGGDKKDWRTIVKELLDQDGGVLNLFAGFPARAIFFFLVISIQFFLYDYFKSTLGVGTDDLTLVLDVFYAIRQGL